ncbi:hypothetical protein [Vibrio splendidus]|uniref:hypothetical protein n=1 Tax=Vibrio splendidus TaxID=29497 RepID=UPI003D12F056
MIEEQVLKLLVNPNVIASTIEGLCTLLASLIPSFIGYRIFTRWNEKRQNDNLVLRLAKQVKFFQSVEQVAIEHTKLSQRGLRAKVFEEHRVRGYDQFTPKKIERLIENYEARTDELVPTEQ